MRAVLKGLVSGFLVGLASFTIQAQYRLDNWTTDNGLPQNSVYAIVQTRDNYIWLATLDGLVRFDGVRFTVFNKTNSPGISNNRFVYLYEDGQGDLWAGTEQSGIVRFHEGKFTSYGLEHGLVSLRVVWLSGDSDGNVVVYPPGMNAAVRWNGETFAPIGDLSSAALAPTVSQSAYCGRNGTELECYFGASHQRFPFAEGFPDLRLESFYASARGSDNSIWIPSVSRLIRFGADGTYLENAHKAGLPDFPLRMITGGTHPNLLAGGKSGELLMTDVESMQSRVLAVKAPETLVNPAEVRAAFEDREDNIWLGSTRGGLFRVRKQFITTYSKGQGLSYNNIYPIFQDSRGTVWIGATQGGFFKYDGGGFSQVEGIPVGGINAIGEDNSARLIFSVGREIWTIEQGQPQRLLDVDPQLRLIYALFNASDGALWAGGQGGLARFKDGAATYFTTNDGIAGDEVKVIIGDGDGGMWIGAYGGLTRYKDGQFQKWTEADGLPSHTIRSLYQDSDGVLWIGTYDAGMARFKDGRFTAFSMKNGLYNDGVFQILEDEHRNFWISSNRGIYRVSRDELNDVADGQKDTVTSVGYGKSDGMLNIECNGGRSPAGTKTRDGKLWFPTQDGVAVIDPENVTFNSTPPPVAIEGLKINNAPVAIEKLFAARQDPDSGIEIGPNLQNFEVDYTALSFINAENSRFKYKLEGLQSDWVNAGTRRTAYYSFVPPGDYTFRVIAANSDGVWNEEGKSIRITILPPFYKTWWFSTFVALCVAGLAYTGFRLRLDQLDRARKSQEEFSRKLLASQEQERQRIAAELHDSLGQSLLIIKNRIALAQSDIDEKETVEEQLSEISHSASSAIDECRDIAYNLRPFQISRFGLSKTLYGMFMRISEVTDINANADIDDIDRSIADEGQINVFRIVQECVNNIIKHSDASKASLTIKNRDGKIEILIKDNGHGFEPIVGPVPGIGKGGFGLIGIAERVKMLGGIHVVESSPGNGTSIHIRLRNSDGDGV